jgi:hypothetical protein
LLEQGEDEESRDGAQDCVDYEVVREDSDAQSMFLLRGDEMLVSELKHCCDSEARGFARTYPHSSYESKYAEDIGKM